MLIDEFNVLRHVSMQGNQALAVYSDNVCGNFIRLSTPTPLLESPKILHQPVNACTGVESQQFYMLWLIWEQHLDGDASSLYISSRWSESPLTSTFQMRKILEKVLHMSVGCSTSLSWSFLLLLFRLWGRLDTLARVFTGRLLTSIQKFSNRVVHAG